MGTAFSLNSVVFQPPSPPSHLSSTKHGGLVWLSTSKGNKIPAIYIDRNANITILISHGNAEDLGKGAERLGIWRCSAVREKPQVSALQADGVVLVLELAGWPLHRDAFRLLLRLQPAAKC